MWYVVGYCWLRHGLRSFCLDRVLEVQSRAERFGRPDRFDVLAYLSQTMKLLPRKHSVEVFCEASLEKMQLELPEDTFLLELQESGTLMRGFTDSLDWVA